MKTPLLHYTLTFCERPSKRKNDTEISKDLKGKKIVISYWARYISFLKCSLFFRLKGDSLFLHELWRLSGIFMVHLFHTIYKKFI